MTIRRWLAFLALCLVATGGGAPAAAPARCDCSPASAGIYDQWVRSEFNRALAVFSGEVGATDIVTATFKVEKVWKGKLGSEVVLPTGAVVNPGGTWTKDTCDWSFEKGKKYLIFAYGARPAEMRAWQCTPTSRLEIPSRAVEILNRIVGGQGENEGVQVR